MPISKHRALLLLGGGSVVKTAAEIGVSPQAVSQWPDELTPLLEDRVLAAAARRKLPAHLIDDLLGTTADDALAVAATTAPATDMTEDRDAA